MWTMCPYLPSKSALAPKQQLYNNINFIHKSIISGVARQRSFFSAIHKLGRKSRGGKNRMWTRRSFTGGAQVEQVCWPPSNYSCAIVRRCYRTKAARCLEVAVCACVRSGTHSARNRAHSPPLSFFLSRRSLPVLQPTAPKALRS